MFGYLRMELVGDRVGEVEAAMREFAEHEGFGLAVVHREHGASTGALWTLLREVSHAGSRHVITPTPTHMEGGGNDERRELLSRLWRMPRVGVWYLDPDDNAAWLRSYRRHRDIPAPHATAPSPPRTLVGCFELRLNPASRGVARIRVHELLARAGLRHLCEQAEQVVSAVVAEAMAAAEPDVFARVAAGYPDLAPANVLTVWLLRREATLEVQVHETASRASDPLGGVLAGFAEHGRVAPAAGGTLSWARIPYSALPAVSHSRLRGVAG